MKNNQNPAPTSSTFDATLAYMNIGTIQFLPTLLLDYDAIPFVMPCELFNFPVMPNKVEPENIKDESIIVADPISTDEQILEREKIIYAQKKDELLKQYEGKFIALEKGNVLDSDSDFSSLAERVYAKEGYRVIFMPFVEKEEKKHRIASPKLKK